MHKPMLNDHHARKNNRKEKEKKSACPFAEQLNDLACFEVALSRTRRLWPLFRLDVDLLVHESIVKPDVLQC
jgi:hypothetical protein